jgi:hypothetical protein
MWSIITQWRGFYRTLYRDHLYLVQGQEASGRRRLVKSSIRTASFLYMLALVMKLPFDRTNAIIAGILAAVFDDLFDCNHECPEIIKGLIRSPQTTTCASEQGVYFRQLYLVLQARLPAWQREQLRQTLLGLAEVEHALLEGRHDESHWAERGAYAFRVYLSLVGVPEAAWDRGAMLVAGEYLQMMDDYEDVDDDSPGVNYFRAHPRIDMDAHYLEVVAPALERLFLPDDDGRPIIDLDFFSEFMETYHAFQIDIFRIKHERAGLAAANHKRRVAAAAAVTAVGRPSPLARLAQHGSYYFTRYWQLGLPTRIRLYVTRMIMGMLKPVIPF